MLELLVKQALSEDEQVLNIAYHSQDWAAVQRLAHKLKGGALYCGAIKLQQACQRLETYLMSGGGPLADKLYQQLIHVLTETRREIRKWLESQES